MNMMDVLLSLIMTILMTGIILGVVQWGSQKNTQKKVAEQLNQVAQAAQQYAIKHQFEILDSATTTAGPNISVQQLIDDGFLPHGFTDRNSWGQNYRIYFRKNEITVPDVTTGADTTEEGITTVVMTEGGTQNSASFHNNTVPGTVAFLPSGGGYVASGVIPNQPQGNLIGAGWQRVLADIGIPDPGAGHLGIISDYDSSSLGHDTMYRVEVPGHPELNAMQTELDMTDHAIKNIKELTFVPHTMEDMAGFCTHGGDETRIFKLENNGFYTCRDGHVQEILDTGNSIVVKDVRLVAHGELVPKPSCSPFTDSQPEIFLAQTAMAEKALDTRAITAFQTYAVDAGENWRVILRVQTAAQKSGEWVYPPANIAQAQATIFCRSPQMASP